uniref:Zinc finger BED domain-containing protein RICESLEEPER 2-like n=1 Tax=Tanacetum cinerariifolium TaxID=118510 RepID=A0A6L2LB78_TANCI|nr:hypothetical protein [Tanacetum cinerariifolium]
MGKKGRWFSAIKKVFTSNSKDKLPNELEKKYSQDKKGRGKCSNTTLRNHITHPHCEVVKAQKNHNSEAGQTSMARDGSVFRYDQCEVLKAQKKQNLEAGQTSMARDGSVFRYDPDYLRKQIAGLVIQRALPFNHFDYEQRMRVFQNTMQLRYTHVSRSTLKRDAMKLWLAAKQEIIDSFGNLDACVNLTTDVWSAPHGVPGSYMCVTAHWIKPCTWQMMKRVISFEEFPSPHTVLHNADELYDSSMSCWNTAIRNENNACIELFASCRSLCKG